jgi:hypothetical protein
LGKANLTHRAGLASDFGKIISIFRIGFVSFSNIFTSGSDCSNHHGLGQAQPFARFRLCRTCELQFPRTAQVSEAGTLFKVVFFQPDVNKWSAQ